MRKLRKYAGFAAGIAGVVLASVLICYCAFSYGKKTIDFGAEYYFICYKITDNSSSAASLSDTVSSYGGAGYILNYENRYYITVSCYYSEEDAKKVQGGLQFKDLNCTILKTERKNIRARGNASLYLGNLKTLHSLSEIAYVCANKLDTGEIGQEEVKKIFADFKSGLNGLISLNQENPFTEKLLNALAICEDRERGFIKSADMRYVQIALIDIILSVEIK